MASCGECRFFYEKNENGECRRYAPRPLISVDADIEKYDVGWPSIYDDDWCGEYEPTTQDDPRLMP